MPTISSSLIYWVTVFERFRIAAIALTIIFGVALVVSLVVMGISWSENHGSDEDKQNIKAANTYCVVFGVLFLIFASLSAFPPSKKDVAFMYIIPSIVNGRVVQKDLPAVYGKIIDYFLKDAELDLDDLRKHTIDKVEEKE